MRGPVIRRAGPEDAAALALVGAATFLESYAHFIPLADMAAHVQENSSEAAYRAFAEDPAAALWIANLPVTHVPIGYALLTRPDLPIEIDEADIELRRIYLLSKWQGSGFGRRLIETAINHARTAGKRRLLIGVHSGNEGAIGFYRRIGAEPVGTRRFRVGTALFDDLVLAMGI